MAIRCSGISPMMEGILTILNFDEPPRARMPPSLAQACDALRFLVSAAGAFPSDQLAPRVRVL